MGRGEERKKGIFVLPSGVFVPAPARSFYESTAHLSSVPSNVPQQTHSSIDIHIHIHTHTHTHTYTHIHIHT
ncbi:hypothetical protein WUBG_03751 [Wuchereria bancrofti]|uniref:Uncharacterized protein n=1 Tax=Wuchereria bancrofti TaxID=6293 RepID=J9ET26_WUCBA|nr:hypothetical protein WUBG_03751 [Wuchereria bancrofti]